MFARLSLSQKMITVIVLLLVMVFATITIVLSHQTNTGVLNLQRQTVVREASILSGLTELMVKEQKTAVRQNATSNVFKKELMENVSYPESREFLRLSESETAYSDYTFLADKNGTVVASTSPDFEGTRFSERDFWKGLSKGEKVFFEPYPQESKAGDPVSIVAAAIHNDEGILIGAFGIAVNITRFAEKHITNLKIGKEGYPYVLTDKGVPIVHPDPNTVMEDISSHGFISEVISSKASGFQEYTWEGMDKIQAFEKLKTMPWYICINTPRNELVALANTLSTTVIIISFITVILLSVIIYLIIRSILLNRFHRFSDVFGKGSKGDLTVRVADSNQDELGSLANHFNDFIENIQSLMKELSTSITDMSSYSQELSSTATEMASTAEELSSQSSVVASSSEQSTANVNTISSAAEQMSSNLEMVATSMEELTASVTEDAQNTQRESRLAHEAQDAADKTVNTMSKLETAAQKIGKVVEIIKDIADQTNLLALNATIEAASAGDAGKGFAVVANEVKELAKQSSQATDEIANQISEIQTSTMDAVEAIKGITGKISEVNSISEMIASSIEEQTATVHEAARNVTEASGAASEIAQNVSESARGLQEISSNIHGVNSAVRNTSEAASNIEKRSSDLSHMSGKLREKISTFKV
ncbi:MAG: methyl-accepting chemotaxis protein [Chitinispirillaceae bacterium]